MMSQHCGRPKDQCLFRPSWYHWDEPLLDVRFYLTSVRVKPMEVWRQPFWPWPAEDFDRWQHVLFYVHIAGEANSPMKRRRSRHASLIGPVSMVFFPKKNGVPKGLLQGGEGTVCVPMIAGLTEQQAIFRMVRIEKKRGKKRKNMKTHSFFSKFIFCIFGGKLTNHLCLVTILNPYRLCSVASQVQGLREVFSLFDPEGTGRVRPEEIRSAATNSGLEKEFPQAGNNIVSSRVDFDVICFG